MKRGLQARPKRVLVEFDDKGGGDDEVFFQKDVFGFGGVGTVGFGEDDYCCGWLARIGGMLLWASISLEEWI